MRKLVMFVIMVVVMVGMIVGEVNASKIKNAFKATKQGDPINVRCIAVSKVFPDGRTVSILDEKIVFDIDGNVKKSVQSMGEKFTYVKTTKNKSGFLIDLYSDGGYSSGSERTLALPRVKFDNIPTRAGIIYRANDGLRFVHISCKKVN